MEDFLPGAASLIENLDKKLLVVLRDGKKLIGFLRSFDQYANLVLQDTVERIYHGDAYGDIHRGVFLIRGENVVLLGEIDSEKDDDCHLREIPVDEVLSAQLEEMEEKKRKAQVRNKLLHARGFSVDVNDPDFGL